MTAIIRWETPPPAATGSGATGTSDIDWRAVADELRARPGEWALIAIRPSAGSASGTAARIRAGGYAGMAAGYFDACARMRQGEHQVSAVYIGDGGA